MANAESNTTKTLPSFGFRIVVGQDKLEIMGDSNAYDLGTRRKRAVTLGMCVVFGCIVFIREFVRIRRGVEIADVPWGLLSICAIAPLLIALTVLYPGDVDLLCTRESVRVTRRHWGRVRRVLVFPAADVRRFKYVSGTFPWFGSPGHLRFLAAGKQVTCLPGLKSIEAQLILDELQKMAFDVERDPEMSIWVQMEKSHRKG